MKIDFNAETLARLLHDTQFEFIVWCWLLLIILGASVFFYSLDVYSRRVRKGDVLHFGHFTNKDPRWGWRR